MLGENSEGHCLCLPQMVNLTFLAEDPVPKPAGVSDVSL